MSYFHRPTDEIRRDLINMAVAMQSIVDECTYIASENDRLKRALVTYRDAFVEYDGTPLTSVVPAFVDVAERLREARKVLFKLAPPQSIEEICR